MFAAYVVAAIIYGLLNVGSALAKIRGFERATGNLTAVGVPRSWFVPLGLLDLAGVAGLWLGIAWLPLAVAAATGLVLYYAGAVLAHVRVRDARNLPMPALLLVLGGVTLALAVASA